VFYSKDLVESSCQHGSFLGADEQEPSAVKSIFTRITSNFKCQSTTWLCALTFYTFFPLGDFEVFKEILENVPKS
jgi:hypothetical protein